MRRAWRWIVVVCVLAAIVSACSEGEPVSSADASDASSSPQTSVLALEVTSTTPPATTAPSTTIPPTTTTTTAPSTTAVPATTTTIPTTTTTVPPSPPAAALPTPAPASSPTEWVVQPGESFWSIAQSIADTRAGGQATLQAVDSLWRALIDTNRAELPTPSNPSLLYVGTALTIPP